MKKVFVVLLALLLVVMMGAPVLAAPSLSLDRYDFNLAMAAWENGSPYEEDGETPNLDYAQYQIRVGNIMDIKEIEYPANQPFLFMSVLTWVYGSEKGEGEPAWFLMENGVYGEIDPGIFSIAPKSVSKGAELNYQSAYDDTSAHVLWHPTAVTPIATRSLQTINGIRYRTNMRATEATCTVSGSIHFTYWEFPMGEEPGEPVERTVDATIPEGCEGYMVAGTIMLQKVG